MNQGLFHPVAKHKNQPKLNKGVRGQVSGVPRRGTVLTPGGRRDKKVCQGYTVYSNSFIWKVEPELYSAKYKIIKINLSNSSVN